MNKNSTQCEVENPSRSGFSRVVLRIHQAAGVSSKMYFFFNYPLYIRKPQFVYRGLENAFSIEFMYANLVQLVFFEKPPQLRVAV